MDHEAQRRLTWVRLFEETHDVGLVCRRCGISRPTLRKWLRRYAELGEVGLASLDRRPHHSPNQKVFAQEEAWILALRLERRLGARRIQHELRREHQCVLSLETIHKVLLRHPTPPVRRPKRPVSPKRYSMRLPGERAQMDTMKLAPGLYQYTLVDDCTRYLVAALYPQRTAATTLAFLDHALPQVPFPIQRLQTDNGTEFLAYKVRDRLLELRIKHRPIRPRTPHLNGKGERAQTTVLDEFYATTSLDSPTLADDLEDWLTDYNYRRVHGSLGMSPIDCWAELEEAIPPGEAHLAMFDVKQEMDYVDQLTLQRLRARLPKK
jgi:transposase InsO family protein